MFAIGDHTLTRAANPVQRLINLPNAPLARWHPAFSKLTTIETAVGTEVAQMNDLVAAAHAISGGSQNPLLGTDGNGRKFVRFNGQAWMAFATATALLSRDITVIMVAKSHRSTVVTPFLGMYGTTGGATMSTNGSSFVAPFLRGHGTVATAATGRNWVIPGCQLQVMGVASGAAAAGGQRCQINDKFIDLTQPTTVVQDGSTTPFGGEIGRYNASPATLAHMTVYEIILFGTRLTNAQLDANMKALMAEYNVAPIANSLIFEGDSLTAGVNGSGAANTALVPSGLALPMRVSGVPNDWRILHVGVSGATLANKLTGRDTANSVFSVDGILPSGRNRVVLQVGINDVVANTAAEGDRVLDDATKGIIALQNTTTTGYLQRGFETVMVINQAATGFANGGVLTKNATDQIRTRMRNTAAILNSCNAGVGQTYDGKVKLIDLAAWSLPGNTVFSTDADTVDLTFYHTDALHMTLAGVGEQARAYDSGGLFL